MAIRIQSKEIEYREKLGEGGFGEVYKAKWNHADVAVKKLALKNLSESTTKEFEKEMNIHSTLRHPHIVQMYGFTSEQPYAMVMEYMENGSLDNYLQKNPPQTVSWLLKYKIALDVIKGIFFLHLNNIIHRDLKSLNILLNRGLDAKVADFGLAKVKAETMSRTQQTTGFKGTIQWIAPELFTFKPVYNAKTDIYSFGIVLWELASHEYPYKETPLFAIPSLVKEGARETFPENTPKVYEELTEKCWAGKAENRPELENAIITLESLIALSNENNKESSYLQPTTNNSKPFTINNSFIVHPLQLSYDSNADFRNLSIEKGIPLVKGQRTDFKADFELLSELTAVSKLTINRFLGEMIEDVPLISKADFDWLNEPDAFEPNTCNKDTYELLVMPSKIRRTNEKEWILDNKGNLIPDPKKQEKTLDIPLTLINLRTLCSSPLDGKQNMPVFFVNIWEEAFEQCQPAPNHASIYFTRKKVVGRNLSWHAQKDLVESKKLEVTPLFVRTWAHCFSILEFNTCLDNYDPWTWARTSDTIRVDWPSENYYELVVGAFVPSSGVNIVEDHFYDNEDVGVAPGWPCENS